MKKIIAVLLASAAIIYAEYVPYDKAVDMLKSVKQSDFPNSNEVYISNKLDMLDKDCTGYVTSESYRLILNEEGKRDNSVFFYEDVNYDSLHVNLIKIIKVSGEVVDLDPKVLLKKQDAPGWSNIYSNDAKMYAGTLPGLESGDIVYEKVTSYIKKQVMENNFFSTFSFEDHASYVSDHYELNIPENVEIFVHEVNKKDIPYDHDRKVSDGRVIYTWSKKNSQRLMWESGSEDWNFITHHLRITTVKDWAEISRWYYNIVKPHMEPSEEMKAKAIEITADAKTREEKASKLFYWVARNVRYLGVDMEKNRPGFEPHDVKYTFDTRGGVCRDKAALLTAMLRLAGIGSDVILISSGSRLNPEAPMLWFNHAITVSYDDKGEPEFIFDPTDETTKDFLPKYEEDNSYLIASEKGGTLRTTPVSPPEKNNSTINIYLKVNGDDAEGKVEMRVNGLADTIARSIFSNYSDHETRTFITRMISGINSGADVEDIKYTDPKDFSGDITVNAKVKIPGIITRTDGHVFIPFIAPKLNIHFLYGRVMSTFGLNDRKFDFQMGGTYSMDTNIIMEFDREISSISIPGTEDLDFMGFKTGLESKNDGKKLEVSYHFESSQIHFKKEDYLPLKLKLSALSSANNLYMIGTVGGKNE